MQTEVRGGFEGDGRGRGLGPRWGCSQLICYNCGEQGHYACDCTNPTRISCSYCEYFDHELIDCSILIGQLSEKWVLQPPPIPNIQMMRVEPREEDPSINMVLRSGTTEGNEGRDRCDTPMKEQRAESKQGTMGPREAQQSFAEVSTLGRSN